jgi:uncharacterized LabA/DUF88 family protein
MFKTETKQLKQNNYAFIDSQNLNLSIRNLGWKLDFRRFRVYLSEKFNVSRAYLFVGYVDKNRDMYKILQEFEYICIFKPTLIYKDGTTKGNCDAELVLHAAAIEYANYDKALIVSGDGDFFCLGKFLKEKNKLKKFLIPNKFSYSALLKGINESNIKYLEFISDSRGKLEYKYKKRAS